MTNNTDIDSIHFDKPNKFIIHKGDWEWLRVHSSKEGPWHACEGRGRFPLPSAIMDCVTSPSPLTSMSRPLLCPVSGNMPGPVWVVNPLECKRNVEYCLGLRQNVTYARPFAQQSPGPPISWPGDRQVVGCGQHLGTWWLTCHFFITVLCNSLELLHSTVS